ncbi:MAG: MotA/TolQ/ExbB proton channel family protein [Campylobacterota bacterium]|nr:MotA/TolQ/ExbB proton channel family protein [Campylobacterota bacterium]
MRRILLLTLLLSSLAFGVTDSDLERAYAKEYAFLKAQKQMLNKRLKSVKSSSAIKIKNAKNDVSSLQNRLLKKGSRNDLMSEELFRAQQNVLNIDDDTALIGSVALQATSALEPYGMKMKIDEENYPETLKVVFQKSKELLKNLSSVRTTEGSFYLADGTQKKGTLVKVGNIATYGLASDVAGALVPAGAGKLKLWNEPDAALSAKALKDGSQVSQLNIFLYENPSLEIDNKEVKTVLSIINSAGIIGWVIVGLGVIGLLLAALRFVFLSGSSQSTTKLAPDALEHLLKDGEAKTLEYLKTKSGATARVLKATIRNLDRDREHIEDIVMESIMHESSRLDRFGSAIMVLAAVAPLLGLLGTVTGMIATFDIITEFGTGDPKLLSGGISIALVTTELGLIVAIPLLLLGNLLSGWAEKIKDAMEHSALHLINEYNKQK